MKLMPFFLFLSFSTCFSQTISVDDTSFSPNDLVNTLLSNSCADVSNVQISSGSAVAYFNNQGGSFPFSEGVIIRSGSANFSEGSYTGANMSSQLNTNSDPYLVQLNASSGQATSISDVAFLQFDFVPISTNFTFNFLFASNEYGQWQCLSSDVFAFLLTDLNSGTTTNLALIPGTQLPISVRNIRDNAYNLSCNSVNPALFSTYNVNNPGSSTLNMRGYTMALNASSNIVPGNTYRIRMVIGDSNDTNFDSAIFLEAGSFDISLSLGPDQTICSGDIRTLNTGLDPSVYQHTWLLNGNVISGETSNSLSVTQTGTYEVSISNGGLGCSVSDQVVFTDLMVSPPEDLIVCHSNSGNYLYDLTFNDNAVLSIPNYYDIYYYASTSDIAAQNEIPISDLPAYSSPGNQTVYIKLLNTRTNQFCDAVYSFELLVNPALNLNDPNPIEVCEGAVAPVDLTAVIPGMLNGQNPNDFNFSFFTTQTDAQNNTNAITNPGSYTIQSTGAVINLWIRADDAQMPRCFVVLNLQIIINAPPAVDQQTDVIACSDYQLPPLTNGAYYSGTNGTGQVLPPGTTIDTTGVYYIFSGPDLNGCTNQSSFEVTLVDEYNVPLNHCGDFIIPIPPAGGFYTQAGGPSGAGNPIAPGTVLTTSQTIYYYVEINGVFCRDDPFQITIFSLPLVDQPSDVVTCDQYILPVLTNGNYYTQPDGAGTQLNSGGAITTSQTLYVFNDDGQCTNQHTFQITIIPDFIDVTACGSYTLPPVETGGYFTQALGGGQQIPVGTVITASQIVYYYAQTTTLPNCTDNESFTVTIVPIPLVDELNDQLLCETNPFVLPTLTNGEYFTQSERAGTQLFPGDTIAQTQIIYINNLLNGCDNESDFTVEIRPLPQVENLTEVFSCDPFPLPDLTYGTYYPQSGGLGTPIAEGTIIDSTQVIYVYNDYDDLTTCFAESFFTVNINGVEVGQFNDVVACDQYVLPVLNVGDYYTDSNAQGTALFAGDTLTVTQEIFVYAENGVRFPCTDQESFIVNISETPVLGDYPNVESCGSYVLPDLTQTAGYQIGYYREPYGEDEILPSEYTFDDPGTYTIFVFTVATDNPDCYDQAVFQVTVYPLLELVLEGGTICINLETNEVEPVLISSGLDPNEFTVNWYLNGQLVHSGPDFEATEAGVYTVETEKLTPETGADCNYAPTTVEVFESAQPIVEVHISEPFSDIAVVNVEIIEGIGDYEYALDDGEFQSSNEFYDVASGTHTITVQGINGDCGATVLEFEVLKHPKFFTPNGDGVNETWNISDLKNHPEALITIFNRYGKYLASFPPLSEGWDGTYNGRRLPSDDYWFVVEYEIEGQKKVFKSHFTLKR